MLREVLWQCMVIACMTQSVLCVVLRAEVVVEVVCHQKLPRVLDMSNFLIHFLVCVQKPFILAKFFTTPHSNSTA